MTRRGQRLRHCALADDAESTVGRGAGRCVHLATPARRGDLGDRGAYAVDAASRPVLDAESGERSQPAAVTVTLLEPYPGAGSSPTGAGNRLWQALDGVRSTRTSTPRTADRVRLPCPRRYPLSATRRCSPPSRERGDALGGPPVHPGAGHPAGRPGVAIAPVTLHTGVSSQEAGEAPQPERFEVPAATAAWSTPCGRRRAGGRGRHHRDPGAESARPATGPVEPGSGWTDLVIGPTDPPGSSTASSPAGTTPSVAPAARRGGGRPAADAARLRRGGRERLPLARVRRLLHCCCRSPTHRGRAAFGVRPRRRR